MPQSKPKKKNGPSQVAERSRQGASGVTLRLNAIDLKMIESAAKATKLTVSEWIPARPLARLR